MTNHTMPVLTDEQREKLQRHLAKVLGRHEAFTPIGEYSECHRLVHEIALALLEDKPKAFLIHEKSRASWLSFQNAKAFNPADVEENEIWQEPLYTSPPVPALKMPDEIRLHGDMDEIYVSAWNACLSETKRLNGVTE
jgi:hypothetical protein